MTSAPTREVRQWSPEALLEVVHRELEPVSASWQGTLERVVTTDWTADAYAGGGWSVYPLPSNDDSRTIVGEPHGHCFFAGEHLAAAYGATMEGALRSGYEAAQLLLARPAG